MNAKEKIFEEAVKLFSLKGYSETTADEIILQSGTSKGLLFYHYKNKESLLKAILTHTQEIIYKSCDIETFNTSAIRELRIIIKQLCLSLKTDLDYWKIYTQVLLNKELCKKLEINLDSPSKTYQLLTVELFRKSGKKNPERWAFSFDIHFRGIYFGYINEPDSFPLEQAKQVMMDMFTR